MAQLNVTLMVASGMCCAVASCYGISVALNPEPYAWSLNEANDNFSERTIGSDAGNRIHLVSSKPSNKKWWEWKYHAFMADFSGQAKPEKFDRIEKGYVDIHSDLNPNTSLNLVCHSAYSETGDSFAGVKDRNSYTQNIIKYCSRSVDPVHLYVPPTKDEEAQTH